MISIERFKPLRNQFEMRAFKYVHDVLLKTAPWNAEKEIVSKY